MISNPKSADAWGKLGQVLHVHSLQAPAVECYDRAQTLDPNDSRWPYLRATIRLVGANPDEARPDLLRAAELGTPNQIARLRLSEFLIDRGELDEAERHLARVHSADSDSSRLRVASGRLAVARRQWAVCLKLLESIGDNPFSRKQSAFLRLTAYQHLGKDTFAEREQRLIQNLAEDEKWPDAILAELDQYHSGVMARLKRSRRLVERQEFGKAIELLTQSVCDYPELAVTWLALGQTLVAAEDYPVAEEMLLKGAELDPQRATLWSLLGLVRKKRGNPLGAIESYRTAIELNPADADAYFKLGECLEATFDSRSAERAYIRVLELNPKYPDARQRLTRLRTENERE